jgi:single-stranded DNA-specific DHH superfamily exonuclease
MSRKLVSWLKKNRETSLILAHADHDGQCAAAVLTKVFGERPLSFMKPSRPSFYFPTKSTRLIINLDLLFSVKQLNHYLERGVKFANLDHHDVRDLKHKNYLCLNPEIVLGKQYVSTSGLLWHLFQKRVKDYAWVLAIGDAGDLCVTDSPELYNHVRRKWPELLNSTLLKDVFSSRIYYLANALFEACRFGRVNYSYNLVLNALGDGPSSLLEDKFLNKLAERRRKLCESFYYRNLQKFFYSKKAPLLAVNSSREVSSSFSLWLNLKEGSDNVFVDYCAGRVFFRCLYGKVNVAELARSYGGGGNNSRVGTGSTHLTFREFCEDCEQKLLRIVEQKKLSDY